MNKWTSRFPVTLLLVLVLMLGLVPAAFAQEPAADLTITETVNRKTVKIGQTITLTITVTNLGPDVAPGITFGDSLPDPLNFVSASCDKGTTFAGACVVDSLAAGESATISINATPIGNPAKSERRFTSTAFIAVSATVDPNLNNNTDSSALRIVGNTR